jgi:hypothetical protein
VKRNKSILCTFGLLLLCCTSEVAYAQEIKNCPKSRLELGSVCKNEGVVHNTYNTYNTYNNYPAIQNPKIPSSRSVQPTQPKPDVFSIYEEPVSEERMISKNKPPTGPTYHNHPAFNVKWDSP